jgi:hypothetical protein
MGQKYRAQILLEQEQHDTLRKIAKREKRSLSEVAREIIEIGLQVREKETENLWRKREDALKRLSQIREEAYQNYGVYAGDLISEARAERNRQQENILKDQNE